MRPSPLLRAATPDDAARVAAIYNQGIAERSSTFETAPRTASEMALKIAADPRRLPFLVAEIDGTVAGWCALSAYRPRACYDGIAEFSIYLDPAFRGRGLGRQLLEATLAAAAEAGYWKLVARIFPFNTASRALCRACGFREVGLYEKHGQLDGRWLDVVIVERLIPENQRQEIVR